MKLLLRGAWLAWLALLTGCAGYQLGNIPTGEMKGVRNIWVPMVQNETFTPYLQSLVTNALIHEFDNDGTYQTGRAGESEATLRVTVVKFERSSVNQNPDNTTQTTQFRGTLTARATLTNNLTGKEIFKDLEFHGSTDYYVPNFRQGGDNIEAERQAMPLAGIKLAQNIIHQITEGW
ncbi:MAG: LPS assembly lipoprotein LptE [Verrucomicrobiales bacterium]|jgi:hypothetical protein|nr:LPS assembly lipoprotein LptE [Verrucomicrobiales bacterium]MDR1305382.1 LPS assembly lipoprotein LptE [Verrucomicrobiales bacterium]